MLRLLATDLTGPELARHLVVSLNTLRTHTRNVYTKLGVSGRRAAVSRARELGLLGGSGGDTATVVSAKLAQVTRQRVTARP